jgi:hypothetical protein
VTHQDRGGHAARARRRVTRAARSPRGRGLRSPAVRPPGSPIGPRPAERARRPAVVRGQNPLGVVGRRRPRKTRVLKLRTPSERTRARRMRMGKLRLRRMRRTPVAVVLPGISRSWSWVRSYTSAGACTRALAGWRTTCDASRYDGVRRSPFTGQHRRSRRRIHRPERRLAPHRHSPDQPWQRQRAVSWRLDAHSDRAARQRRRGRQGAGPRSGCRIPRTGTRRWASATV